MLPIAVLNSGNDVTTPFKNCVIRGLLEIMGLFLENLTTSGLKLSTTSLVFLLYLIVVFAIYAKEEPD